MKFEDELRVEYTASLNDRDSATQTQGCRHTNPDICKSAMLEGKCAFVTPDKICTAPSRSWRLQYKKLKEKEGVEFD